MRGALRILLAVVCVLLVGGMFFSRPALAADEENCLLCHKYAGLARFDDLGQFRLFYVSGSLFKSAVHAKILCRECHQGLDQIPHDNPPRVNCSTKCHLKEPSTDKDFSHTILATQFAQSVHGKGTTENPKKYPKDLPECTDCHINTVLAPISDITTLEGGVSGEAIRRCRSCHEEKSFVDRFYRHFGHRMHRARTSVETVKMCLLCHQDEEKMARHGLVATANYQDTYHWKAVVYGDANAPDCISCHAPVGFSIHALHSRKGKDSPVAKENLIQTCSNVLGTQKCHPGATLSFATGRVHATGLGFEEMVSSFVKGEKTLSEIDSLRKERRFRTLLSEADVSTLTKTELFQHKIYSLVKFVYKLLITTVIGGMLIHQFMDLYRIVSNRRKSKRGIA